MAEIRTSLPMMPLEQRLFNTLPRTAMASVENWPSIFRNALHPKRIIVNQEPRSHAAIQVSQESQALRHPLLVSSIRAGEPVEDEEEA